jgi:hypothetical protein
VKERLVRLGELETGREDERCRIFERCGSDGGRETVLKPDARGSAPGVARSGGAAAHRTAKRWDVETTVILT